MRCANQPVLVLVVLLAGMHICSCTNGDEPNGLIDSPVTSASGTVLPAAPAGPAPLATENRQVNWIAEYDEARLKGIEQSKPVLMFVTTDNCLYCRKMYSEAFRDQGIIHELQQKFVPAQLKLDPTCELAQQLRITIYPTTLIINPDGTIVEYARGFLTTEDLKGRMAKVSAAHERVAALPSK